MVEKKKKATPFRGFTDDDESIPQTSRLSRDQKVNMLQLMLGQIANYCSFISRNTIVKNSSSIDQIWQTIRLHYGFQTTGAHFIDFDFIRFDPSERPEDLFERLTAFVEDNLLRKDTSIRHYGQVPDEDELYCLDVASSPSPRSSSARQTEIWNRPTCKDVGLDQT